MQRDHLLQLKNFLIKSSANFNIKIILFGSRARGDYNYSSDLDIAIKPLDDKAKKYFIKIKEKLENFNTPYKLNIIDLSSASESIKNEIKKDGIIWKD